MDWKEILMFLVETGTNGYILDFVENNFILLSIIVVATPFTWDNKILSSITGRFGKNGDKDDKNTNTSA